MNTSSSDTGGKNAYGQTYINWRQMDRKLRVFCEESTGPSVENVRVEALRRMVEMLL